jgi:hypothetical protein
MSDKDGPVIRPDADDLKPKFMRSDLSNVAFYQANEKAILDAMKDGRIVDDVSPFKPKWGVSK